MSGRGRLQFVPSLEALDERANPSPVLASAELDAVAGQVRHRGFAIVDRTPAAAGETYSGTHALYQDVTIPAGASSTTGNVYTITFGGSLVGY